MCVVGSCDYNWHLLGGLIFVGCGFDVHRLSGWELLFCRRSDIIFRRLSVRNVLGSRIRILYSMSRWQFLRRVWACRYFR